MQNLKDIVKADMCLGCGLCTLNKNTDELVEMYFSSKKGHVIPKIKNINSLNARIGFDICPGKGYKIDSLAKEYNFGDQFNKDLGYFNSLTLVTLNNKKIMKNASSSGIMTLLLDFLIKNKIIDKAIVTKFEYTENGPNAIAFATNQLLDLLKAQGSKYCPVNFDSVLEELKEMKDPYTYAFVGTPCQIASLRYIQDNIQHLGIKYFIGNFCGGFKSYNNLKRLIKLNKMKPEEVNYFRFRGGGQPGSMMIRTNNKSKELPYPEYVKMTGYSKVKRCHFCVDATAELADFSCGDAWLPEYINSKLPTSIVITRTKEATEILERICKTNTITSTTVSQEDVIKSQIDNIKTKKYRQSGRIKLYKLMRYDLPEIKEGLILNKGNTLLFEFNVFLSHKVKFIFEKLGLFFFFYYKNRFFKKVLFKLFKDNYN